MEPTEQARFAARKRQEQAERVAPEGFVHCPRCSELTQVEDLYLTDDGEVCHQCHAAEEAHDTLSRGTRNQALAVFFSPGYAAVVVAILQPLATLMFGVQTAGAALSVVPFIGALITAFIAWTAVRLDGETRDRFALAASAGFATIVQLLLAASLVLL